MSLTERSLEIAITKATERLMSVLPAMIEGTVQRTIDCEMEKHFKIAEREEKISKLEAIKRKRVDAVNETAKYHEDLIQARVEYRERGEKELKRAREELDLDILEDFDEFLEVDF